MDSPRTCDVERRRRHRMLLAAISSVVVAAGLFGVLAHAVSSRITEIGLRRAIGATGRSILSLLLHHNGRPVVIGAVAGLLLGFGLSLTSSKTSWSGWPRPIPARSRWPW